MEKENTSSAQSPMPPQHQPTPLPQNQEPTPDLNKALASAQGEFPDVPKNKTGKVTGTTASGKDYEYTYKYADIADITTAIFPVLSKHGLSITNVSKQLGEKKMLLRTYLRHTSGQALHTDWIYPSLGEPKPNGKGFYSAQDLGSFKTYGRRYNISELTGIAAEEDDDGAGATQGSQAGKGGGNQRPPNDPTVIPSFSKEFGGKKIGEVPPIKVAEIAEWCIWKKRDKGFTDECFKVIPNFGELIEKVKQTKKEKAAAKQQ